MNDYAAIFATLSVVVAGGLLNFFSNRTVKQHEWRLTLARDQIIRREALYTDYLAEIQRLTVKSIYKLLEIPTDLQNLDRLLAQMTLLSPSSVTEAARALRLNLRRNRTLETELEGNEPDLDALNSAFVVAARSDLIAYRGDA